ncbi:hypothetical protein [Streptomyces sp. NPDC001435]|uniref:hypothetical protein n=1 Tax=unclassified Streptomyces TaxID=2593676 RepID=UPI0036C6F505
MSRRLRTGGAFGHLLLVVVLALGVFVMHTVGHPDDSASTRTRMASHASMETTGDRSAAHEPTASTHASQAAGQKRSTSADTPVMAMDMLSLCTAVMLGAWVLAALLRAALSRHPDWLADLLARAPVLRRPNPPPRGPALTQLSVLRL